MQLYKLFSMLINMLFKCRIFNWICWGHLLNFTFIYVALLMNFFVIALLTLTK